MSHDMSNCELETLLNEDASGLGLQRPCAQLFDHLAAPFERDLVLFGAGCLGRKILACLRRHGIEPLAFADNSRQKWGEQVDGLKVVSPNQACAALGQKAAFVVTIASPGHSFRESRRKLTVLGCGKVIPFLPLLWKYPDDLLPHYAFVLPERIRLDREAIRAGFRLFEDPLSQRQFIAHLRLRLCADFETTPEPSLHDQYFPEGLPAPHPDEVFVDCGAYDGDTIRALLQRTRFKRLHAFEPDPSNFAKLGRYVQTLGADIRRRIEIVQAAVGAGSGTRRFSASGTPGATLIATAELEIACLRLDDVVFPEAPTFVKIDIEGAETEALDGARELITAHRPVLAICVYHRPTDLWRIPILLHSLNPDYRLFLRSHSHDGWDCVAYAFPAERIQS